MKIKKVVIDFTNTKDILKPLFDLDDKKNLKINLK